MQHCVYEFRTQLPGGLLTSSLAVRRVSLASFTARKVIELVLELTRSTTHTHRDLKPCGFYQMHSTVVTEPQH